MPKLGFHYLRFPTSMAETFPLSSTAIESTFHSSTVSTALLPLENPASITDLVRSWERVLLHRPSDYPLPPACCGLIRRASKCSCCSSNCRSWYTPLTGICKSDHWTEVRKNFNQFRLQPFHDIVYRVRKSLEAFADPLQSFPYLVPQIVIGVLIIETVRQR